MRERPRGTEYNSCIPNTNWDQLIISNCNCRLRVKCPTSVEIAAEGVCCRVLWCIVVCCRVLQCVVVYWTVLQCVTIPPGQLTCVSLYFFPSPSPPSQQHRCQNASTLLPPPFMSIALLPPPLSILPSFHITLPILAAGQASLTPKPPTLPPPRINLSSSSLVLLLFVLLLRPMLCRLHTPSIFSCFRLLFPLAGSGGQIHIMRDFTLHRTLTCMQTQTHHTRMHSDKHIPHDLVVLLDLLCAMGDSVSFVFFNFFRITWFACFHIKFLYSNTNKDHLITSDVLCTLRVIYPTSVEIALEGVFVAVCSNVLQCCAVVAVFCNVLQSIAVCCSMLRYPRENCHVCLCACLSAHPPYI